MLMSMKRDARKLQPIVQEELRRRAVAAIHGGMRQVEAAEVFGVARKTVWQWLTAYATSGDSGLAARKRGPKGGGGKLKGWQAAAICNLIRDHHPEQLKLPFVLWTSEAVQRLIARRFGVKLSARSVRRYLQGWGFTPQKPVRRAYERDPVAVTRWLDQEYPVIRARSKVEKAKLYWGDAMGARSDHQAGRSYAPRGQTPIRPGTGNRFGANVLSAITNRGDLAFMVFKRHFTARVFVRFLRRLVKHTERKVFLIVDGHPVHRSQTVRNWLDRHRAWMEMFFLPAYSPDLNPDEMLNQDIKANAVGRKRARTQSELMRNLRGYLNCRRDNPSMVMRYFHEKSVRYAAV
jgi:transposase